MRGTVREVQQLSLKKLFLLTGLSLASLLADDVVRVTETDAKKAIVSKVEPEYPSMARNMHLAGRAVVDVYIDQDGKVERAQPVSGNPLLTGAAVSAVKKWKFNNTFGKKAVAAIAFDFKL